MKIKPAHNKFDYGEGVRILEAAPKKYHPSEIGFICGIMDIDSHEATIAYDCIGSDWLYTVKLFNGISLQIPEKYTQVISKVGRWSPNRPEFIPHPTP